MISAHHLEHSYRNRRVLSIERLDLERGTVTALVGPNGSGKSTLLRLLAFIERPAAGTVLLDGQPVVTRSQRRRARRRVTLVEQEPLLFRGTVRDNMLYALSLHGLHAREADRMSALALERLNITPLASEPARSLSAGQVQRVAIARAIALAPDALLLDEPTSSADRGAAAELYRVIEEERERGTVLCFASHQLEDAYRWSERLIALTEGRTDTVTPENLFRTVLAEGSGLQTVQLGPIEVQVVTDIVGPVTVALPPDEITVSRGPLASSARNQFPGRVTRIADDGRGGVTLRVNVGVELSVRITRRAFDDLDISLGSEVVLSIKAMAVRVF